MIIISNIESKESLFQPGQPVNPDRFKGREDILNEIIRYFPSITSGNPQHFFITGKRGMGKSSLAQYVADFAEKNYSMVSAHIMNDGVHSVEELVMQIIERVLNEIKSEKWSSKIFKYMSNTIESVGFGGLNIRFTPNNDELINIKDNFAFYLSDLVSNFKDKDGIFIIIDDINGLTDTPEFANWYKSFTDTLATSVDNAPIGFMLTGYPKKFNKLYEHNPSFNRIFHVSKLEELFDDEVGEFLKAMFSAKGVVVSSTALDTMVDYSCGIPSAMQEIGDAVFWSDNDNFIDNNDALKGIISAGNRIGDKYLQPILDEKIRSKNYLSMLNKIGFELASKPNQIFNKSDFDIVLTDSESRVFSDFISRSQELGILESVGSGMYQFVNPLYPIYFSIKNLKDH